MLMLAARNLLIEAVSFYSYYGRQQIYRLFDKGNVAIDRKTIARHIRIEIKKLFGVCKADNKLVLTRIMKQAEREFELSIKAIQVEAEQAAIDTVRRIMPASPRWAPEKKKNWLDKLIAWMAG